ncbi:MAG: hypothetical protein M3495_21995 [Pseudomonadota bacterium]|nr:hypothetical protein [Pseudomonadota bacterium]
MLQQRQLVRVSAEIVDQPVDQLRVHPPAEHPRRPGDGQLQFLAGQPGGEVLAVAHRLGQTLEHGALAEVVRPHGDDDIDRRLALAGAGEQEGDEGIGLLDGDPLAIAEDLLELVRHDQQGGALQRLGPLDDLDQSEGTAPQCRVKESRGFFAVPAGSEDIG